jgi:guanylate kinase
MIDNKELIEYATYVGNYYGTPKKYVLKQLESGKDVILEIEMQGALQVKKQFEDALLVFVTAPTAKDIKDRLIYRGTESLELINKRLEKSYTEINAIEDYDYILINDGLDETVDNLNGIIKVEHERVKRNKDLKDRLKKEFEVLLKGE